MDDLEVQGENPGQVKCAFCTKEVAYTTAAEMGWEPYFYANGFYIDQPVCPECHKHIKYNDERGECEIAVPRSLSIITYAFVPDSGVFHFLQEPTQDEINHLLFYRPGCTYFRSVNETPALPSFPPEE